MKIILIVTIALVTASCIKENPKKIISTETPFYINKTDSTYEVYSTRRELILVFNTSNTDSSSLETLDYIYETVKDFYNRGRFEETSPGEKPN